MKQEKYKVFFGGIFVALLMSTSVLGTEKNIPITSRVKTDEKVIAITFDDGPNPDYTEKIQSILKKENVHATFFLLGKNIEKYPSLVQETVQNGHDIGNHSFSHRDFAKLSDEEAMEELRSSQAAFYNLLGSFPVYFRPPYGNLLPRDMPVLKKYFIRVVKWNIDTKDWKDDSTATLVYDIAMKHAAPGAIILCHDNNEKSLEALPKIIHDLKNKGFRFVTISELLNLHKA